LTKFVSLGVFWGCWSDEIVKGGGNKPAEKKVTHGNNLNVAQFRGKIADLTTQQLGVCAGCKVFVNFGGREMKRGGGRGVDCLGCFININSVQQQFWEITTPLNEAIFYDICI